MSQRYAPCPFEKLMGGSIIRLVELTPPGI
jgi:hypothetical protein